MDQRRLHRSRFFMVDLVFLAADKAGQIPLLPKLPDKLVHFCYYGIMALLRSVQRKALTAKDSFQWGRLAEQAVAVF